MNAKRIVLSLGTLVFAAAVVAGGTGAFFSATETAEGNVFTAGTVSLDMGAITHDYGGDDNNAPIFTTPGGTSFALDDLKPLDTGNITFELENGANETYVCAMVTNDPDDAIDAAGLALYDQLNFFQDDGTQVVPGEWFSLGSVAPNSPVGTGVDYCFGDSNVDGGLISCDYGDGSIDYNAAQGGSFEADLMFYAIQTRNNDDFSCDQLTMNDGEPEYIPDEDGGTNPEVTEGSGWSPVDIAGYDWFAKSKIQETNPASDFEVQVGVGDSNPADFDQGDTVYPNGDPVAFTLTYDGAGNASFEANGVTTNYAVGTDSIEDIGITVRAPADATTAVDNLTLDTGSLSDDDVSVSNGTMYLLLDGADLDSGFTLSGDLTMTWIGSTPANGENQKMQIAVN